MTGSRQNEQAKSDGEELEFKSLSGPGTSRPGVFDSVLSLSSLGIQPEVERFRDIVKGRVRDDLKKHVTRGDFVDQKGSKKVSIPIHDVKMPRFRHGSNQNQGVGQGNGEEGDAVGGQPQPGEGEGEAGEDAGEMITEDVSFDELAEMLAEELELPRLEPKQGTEIEVVEGKYRSIARKGPNVLRHNRLTLQNALKRQIGEQSYDADDPKIIPIKEDMRYRSPKLIPRPKTQADIVFMRDKSGSMGEQERELCRNTAFWIQLYLEHEYKGCNIHYILHDAEAYVVDEHTFFHAGSTGGTKISSSLITLADLLRTTINPEESNVYPFHFTDGDNWGGGDNEISFRTIEKEILPFVNQFSYVQVRDGLMDKRYSEELLAEFGEREDFVAAEILDKEDIWDGIKELLGRGN